jgi:uncharacterized protein (TIGR00266 family)
MEYKINGTTMQTLEIILNPGENIYSQTHQMAWMDPRIQMQTDTGGGIWKALKRSFSGASFFLTHFTAVGGPGLVAFAPRFPGQIIVRDLAPGQSLVCRKETFLCAEQSVNLDIFFRQNIGAGLFGGEGFILQKLTGPGKVFLDLSGEVVEKKLQPGEILRVHVGHVGVQDATIDFNIEMVPGFTNVLFGGQGLFVARLTGPGNVLLQSMPIVLLAEEILRYAHRGGDTQTPAPNSGGILGSIVGNILNGGQ